MTRFNIPFPFAGRRDDSAHFQQPELTTRQAQNVRGRARNGRLVGAARGGMSKFNPSAVGVGRVRALCSTAIDDRKLAYSYSSGTEAIDWETTTPSKSDCLDGRVDGQGNVYALDGNAGIVKYNSRGTELLKIALPVADPSHLVRALWVEPDGKIFAGVSSGGDMRTARMWCVLQLQDNQYFVLWTLEVGIYTEELRLYGGSQLYAAHNDDRLRRAHIVVYENVGLDPAEGKRVESVAWPIHGFDMLPTGEFYTASALSDYSTGTAPNAGRRGPAFAFVPPLVGWKPTDDSTISIWSWYDAEEIDETDVEQTTDTVRLVDGQQILRWRDKSGNGRDLFAGSLFVTAEAGPLYVKEGICSKPCVRFDSGTGGIATIKHSLVSLGNASVDTSLAGQQRTMIPGYTDSMWAMFMVIRPTPDSDATTPSPRTLFYAENEAGGGATDHYLFLNRDSKTTALPGTADVGFISYETATDSTGDGGGGAAGPPPRARGYDFRSAPNGNHQTGCVLVCILWDGGVQPNDTTKTRCLVRFNGQPIDRFEGLAFKTTQPTWLGLALDPEGFANGEDVARRYRGEVAEILVVDRRNRLDNTTEPKVLTYDALETGSPNTDQTDNQVTRIEAYLAYKWGIPYVLPNDDGLFNYQHPYGPITAADVLIGPPKPGVGGEWTASQPLLMSDYLVSKHDSQGVLKWTASSGSGAKGGYGWGVRARKIASDNKIHVWSVGDKDGLFGSATNVQVRKMIDKGDSFSQVAGDGAWTHSAGVLDFDYEYLRMAADEFGNLYLPYFETTAAAQWSVLVFQKDGSAGAAQVLVDFLLADSQQAHAATIPPDSLNPDYRTDLATKMAEAVYIFTRNAGTATTTTVHKLRLVTSTPAASGTPNSIHTIAVLEDDVRRITDSTNVIPSGGTAVIDPTSQYVQALRAGEDIVIVDGVRYWAYSLRDGTVSELKSTSAGEIPPRGKLAMFWRHRLVVGCFADAPANYAASRLGNIRDWNLNPGFLPNGQRLFTSTQAFTGTATRAGEAEDSITALIPVWDDLAFIGCQSRILRLTGDPQDGGNIHKVTDSMGIAFGEAWCKDQSGRVFVWGNQPPGLYMLQPEGDPVPLSRHTLEESEFEAIDYATNRILLVWNPIARGVHIFQVAWGTSAIVSHWFWEEKTHQAVRQPPIWTDKINNASYQPTCATYFGGDDTRNVLIGCADGYVRNLDDSASDDGTPIDSYVLFGPLNKQGGPDAEWRMRTVQVTLANDMGGVRLELFGSEVADVPGDPLFSKLIGPGLNNAFRARVKAPHLWVRLRNVFATRWALEGMSVEMEPVSKQQAGSEVG